MDSSAVNINVTVDDFDSVISYENPSVWQTPDPSSPTFNASATPWRKGTYHRTDAVNASLSFNFTGPSIYLYGGAGPTHGSYEVVLDSSSPYIFQTTNISGPNLLFSATNLTYEPHTVVLRNLGAPNGSDEGVSLLFDYLQTTVQLAPANATVSNTTIEEDNSALTYTGTWGTNKSPNFSGGGSTYTQGNNASVSLSFHASAIYVFGDKKNDHGLYNVILDNGTAETYNGVSGCGSAFGMTCEQMQPTLKYFASNLNDSLHTLRIENVAGVNNSFFDLDSIVLTVPSVYAPRNFSTRPSIGNPTNTSGATSIRGDMMASNSLPLLLLGIIWLLRWTFRP